MKSILKYWKVLIALILIGVAMFLHFEKYQKELADYQIQVLQMQQLEEALKGVIEKNKRYEGIQDELDAAMVELDASRLGLYQNFPVELKEEDQIMYVLYLETLFGTEINFNFSQPQVISALYDGSSLQGLLLQVNYETTYQGFQDMVSYLANDDRIASVYDATIAYDAKTDTASGVINLVLYLMDNTMVDYVSPDVAIPELGKDNIFK